MREQEYKDSILHHISQGSYKEALKKWHEYEEAGYPPDDVACILGGSIYHELGYREEEWRVIRQGLQYNPENAELYVMLGNYYLKENCYQAYLCYENGLYYAEGTPDYPLIQALFQQFMEEYQIKVPKSAFVILSYNLLDYTKQCIESIRANVPETSREIIVVDNASGDGSVEWLREQSDIVLVENKVNKGFPMGCNQGIGAASPDADIFLLNNDTIVPKNSLFWLRMGLYADERNGAAGSVSNYVANLQQVAGGIQGVEELLDFARKNNVPMEYPYEKKLYLIGFALLIKRSVLNQVGLLDERFTPGNSEDEDYGLRVLMAGYHNVLCRNSFILHFGSKSFGKTGSNYAAVLEKNRKKLDDKWGISTRYYLYPRLELIGMIEEPEGKEMRILDIGCGCGAMMSRLKGIYPKAVTYGIELIERAAEIASHMGEVVCADVEAMEMPWPEEFFDYVIMGDVLEHLRRPDIVLKKVYKLLKKKGYIIVSMPNMKHYSVMLPLLVKDVFPYSNAGILDTTHLKMYTGTEIQKLIVGSGYRIVGYYYTNVGEPNEQEKQLIDYLTRIMERQDRNSFLAYQYLVKAVKD